MRNDVRPPAVNLEEGPIYGTELGDLGIIAIAALITITGLLLLILPSPFGPAQKEAAQQAKIQALQAKKARQAEIDKAVASGEVGVEILPAKGR